MTFNPIPKPIKATKKRVKKSNSRKKITIASLNDLKIAESSKIIDNKYLDELWSAKVRSRGYCERCRFLGKPSGTPLQAHHIIPRTNWNLRWDIYNSVCLCVADHLFWAHKDSIEFFMFLLQSRGIDSIYYLMIHRYSERPRNKEIIAQKILKSDSLFSHIQAPKNLFERIQKTKTEIKNASITGIFDGIRI